MSRWLVVDPVDSGEIDWLIYDYTDPSNISPKNEAIHSDFFVALKMVKKKRCEKFLDLLPRNIFLPGPRQSMSQPKQI
jgi:hypothetical protein